MFKNFFNKDKEGGDAKTDNGNKQQQQLGDDSEDGFLDLSGSSNDKSSSSSSNNSSSGRTRESMYSRFLTDDELNDIVLKGTDGVRVPANRAVLASKSRVFRKLLLGSFSKSYFSESQSSSRSLLSSRRSSSKRKSKTNLQDNGDAVVAVPFRGTVIRAVVEYVLTDSAQILEYMTVKQSKKKERPETTTASGRSPRRHQSSDTASVISLQSVSSRRSTATKSQFVVTRSYRYDRAQIHTLVSLTAAAVHFQLPDLGSQALCCLQHLLQTVPNSVFAVLEACRQDEFEYQKQQQAREAARKDDASQSSFSEVTTGNKAATSKTSLIPVELQGLAQSSLRNFTGPLIYKEDDTSKNNKKKKSPKKVPKKKKYEAVGFLSSATISEILQNEKLRMGEYQLFELLCLWIKAEGAYDDDANKKKDNGKDSSDATPLKSNTTPRNGDLLPNPSKDEMDQGNHSTNHTSNTAAKPKAPSTPTVPKTPVSIPPDSPSTASTIGTTMENNETPVGDAETFYDTSEKPDKARPDALDLSPATIKADNATGAADKLDISTRKTPASGDDNTFTSYPTFAADLADRKTMVTEYFIQRLKLHYIDPVLLSTKVAESGLVTQGQLLKAFQKQALMARQYHNIDFSRPRNRTALWKNGMSELFISRDGEFKEDVLQYPPMTDGVHRWNVLIEDSGDSTWLGLSLSQIHKNVRILLNGQHGSSRSNNGKKDEAIHDRNWVYSNDGDAFHGGSCFGSHAGFTSGTQVTLTINLLPDDEVGAYDSDEEPNNGTLSASIDGGPRFVLFTNLRASLAKYPGEGFLPSVSMHDPGRVRLVDIRHLEL